MNIYSQVFKWHSKYQVILINDSQLLLLSEQEQYLLPVPNARELMQILGDGKSLDDFIENSVNIMLAPYLAHHLSVMLQQGYICTHDEVQEKIFQLTDFSQQPVSMQLANKSLSILLLSQFYEKELLTAWIDQITIERLSRIVIVDDYLDPRLEKVNDDQTKRNEPWLLMKLTGERVFIGPYFVPGEECSPCWQCVAGRMLRNQPVRSWLKKNKQRELLPLPISYNNEQLNQAISYAVQQIEKIVRQKKYNSVFEFQLENQVELEHSVNHLPQCSFCGDPEMFTQKNQGELVLDYCLKTFCNDGGVRSTSPEQTISIIKPHISPLFGVINHLSQLKFVDGKVILQKEFDEQLDDTINIYQSSYYSTPNATDIVDADAFVKVCLGKGVSHCQSQASALCETIERFSAQYQGDEFFQVGTPADLQYRCISPHQLAPFSCKQYEYYQQGRYESDEHNRVTKPYKSDQSIHWTTAWSLSKQELCYLPLSHCYANTPFKDAEYCRWNSNGCAAGNTLEEAVLQGFFELIERDATAIWWYNKLQFLAVDVSGLIPQNLQRLQAALDKDWDYWVLDISHDFAIPVMVAVAQHKRTKKFLLGLGCHLRADLACQRALTELCQLIPVREQSIKLFDFDAVEAESYLFPRSSAELKSLHDYDYKETKDIRDDIQLCVERLDERDFETLVVDYSRPDLPINTVKVVVPGLCHIWPQFGNERLYQLPVELGWRDFALDEDGLNGMDLTI